MNQKVLVGEAAELTMNHSFTFLPVAQSTKFRLKSIRVINDAVKLQIEIFL